MTDETDELPRSSWHEALDALTEQHQGDEVTIELPTLEEGDQYQAERVPFAYIEYDPHDDAVSVAIGGADHRYPVVLRHVIEHPQRVLVSIAVPGEASTVEVIGADGVRTLITLHVLPALLA
jgi:hypothetical protein